MSPYNLNLNRIPLEAIQEMIEYKGKTYKLVRSTGIFRSVLYHDGRAVSVMPPKAQEFETFSRRHLFDQCIINEYIVGDSVNLFYDKGWKVHTDKSVGGDIESKFFDAITFELISLDKQYCYCFVLRPPAKDKSIGSIFIITSYKITADNIAHNVDPSNIAHRPEGLKGKSYKDIRDIFSLFRCHAGRSGAMIYHVPSGVYTKILNPIYVLMRRFTKADFYNYCLTRDTDSFTKKDSDFLGEQIKSFVVQLHRNYLSCYVAKERPLGDYPENFTIHMHELHRRHNKSMRRIVTEKVVMQYVEELHPSKLAYTIIHPFRNEL